MFAWLGSDRLIPTLSPVRGSAMLRINSAKPNKVVTMTNEQIKAIRAVAAIILEAIEAAGERGVPSGHLYAMLMGKMSLDQYNQIISGLKRAGFVSEEYFLLKATGKTMPSLVAA